MSPTTGCACPRPRRCGETQQMPAKTNGSGLSRTDSAPTLRQQKETIFRHLWRRRNLVVSPGSSNHRGRRRAQSRPALPCPPHNLQRLLLLLLLLHVVGLQNIAVVHASRRDSGAQAQDGSVSSTRRLVETPDLTLDVDNDGGLEGGDNDGDGGGEASRASLDDDETLDAGGAADAGEGVAAGGGELLPPEESAASLLADGERRCVLADGDHDDVEEDASEEGGSRRRLLCLPTLFFLGVSKCGTTSFSEWMSHHPLTRWVRRPQHLYYLEAHVFDYPPDAAEWRRSATSPSSLLRDRLAVEAREGDTVIDYTPNYSLVAEVPYRIADMYGQGGPLRERGLKFLVLLREPAARTISSWTYKTDPEVAARVAQARHPEVLLASLASGSVEARPLKQAVEEGMEMVARLSACVANATAAEGGYGLGGNEVTICDGGPAPAPTGGSNNNCEDGRDPGRQQGGGGAARDGEREQGHQQQGMGGGCEGAPCETFVEPWCNPVDFLENNLYDAHVGKSAYALQLARWFAVFGRENFKVIFTEDMAKDPMGTLEGVLDFMELDLLDTEGVQGLREFQDWEDIVRTRSNEADPDKKAKLAPQVTPEIVESLRDFFAPHNAALEELLGVPVPAGWRTRR